MDMTEFSATLIILMCICTISKKFHELLSVNPQLWWSRSWNPVLRIL